MPSGQRKLPAFFGYDGGALRASGTGLAPTEAKTCRALITNNPGQICEAFLLAFSDRTPVTLFLLSYFILICDAPFVNARSMLMIYRVKKVVWGAGMILYMAVHTVIFYGIIFCIGGGFSAFLLCRQYMEHAYICYGKIFTGKRFTQRLSAAQRHTDYPVTAVGGSRSCVFADIFI